MTVTAQVLRVFTDAQSRHGNYLGLVMDGGAVAAEDRIAIAGKLGFSATVFVDDVATGAIRIFTPLVELSFAGHPVIGTAWAICRQFGSIPPLLRSPAGELAAWDEDGATWVTAPLASTPAWWHERLESAAIVDALRNPLDPCQDATQLWAWEDEPAGVVRARVYAARLGIVEDEACGSASMRLSAALGRPLTVRHGNGSVIFVRPGTRPGTADVGGLVVAEADRRL